MSWAAHDLEPYAIQKHSRLKIAFVPLLLGSYAPDLMSKWYVYGIHLGPWKLKASDPAQFHRGWPGLGFTHSFLYGVVICLIFWKVLGSKNWGVSFLIGSAPVGSEIANPTISVARVPLSPWSASSGRCNSCRIAGGTSTRCRASPAGPGRWSRRGARSATCPISAK